MNPAPINKTMEMYFIEASEKLAKQQGYVAISEEETRVWLAANFIEIVTLASDLQLQIINKLGSPEGNKTTSALRVSYWERSNIERVKIEAKKELNRIIR